MGTFFQDIRYGIRVLARKPGFTALAILTLALGIGANTAIFSVVDAALLRPLAYAEADRIVRVQERNKKAELTPVAYRNFADWSAQSRCFASAAAVLSQDCTLTGQGEAERLRGAKTSAGILAVLGASPALGRGFLATDDQAGADPVVLVSDALWRRRFNADAGVIGRTLMLDGRAFTVIGVLPPGLQLPLVGESEFIVPAGPSIPGSLDADRGARRWDAIARLAPGSTLASAQTEMSALAARLEAENPVTNASVGFVVSSLQDSVVGQARPLLWLLTGAVGLVLLIVCANLTNLLLARGATRQHELAVRAALGASRWQLTRQMLVESLLLAGLGGALGWLVAGWGVDFLSAMRPASLAALPSAAMDLRVGGFALGLVGAIGLALGALLGWRSGRADPAVFLKSSSDANPTGFHRSRLRGGLVIGEMALAVLLALGAGLLTRSFARFMRVETGLQPAGVLTMQVALPSARYPKPARAAFFNQLIDRVRALPGIEAVGAIDRLPLSGGTWKTNYWVIGDPMPRMVQTQRFAECAVVAGDYFKSVGIPLRQGRFFDTSERQTKNPTILIDESIARKCWPDQNAVGKQLEIINTRFEVVGVVGLVRPFGREAESLGQIYLPQELAGGEKMTLTVRSSVTAAATVAAVRGVLRSLDPELLLDRVRPMSSIADEMDARRRFAMWLFGAFASMAVVLAAGGIYAVLAYLVAERTREIGIRVALGGQTGDVLRLIIGQGMTMAGAGLVLGLVGGVVATRFLASELYRTSPLDLLTFCAVPAVLLTVALLACWLPARRATKVDPIVALRSE
jgi:putative ABC transport system permease protein